VGARSSSTRAAIGVAIITCFSASTAVADEGWAADVLGTFTAAVTDNAMLTEDARRETNAFAQIVPGLVLRRATARTTHVLSYDLELTLYADADGPHTVSNRFRWFGFVLASPLTQVTLRASASHGKLNLLSTAAGADSSSTSARPGGATDYVSTEASEHVRWRLSRPWALYESGSVRGFGTLADSELQTRVVEVGGAVGIERLWRRTAVAAELRARGADLNNRVATDDSLGHRTNGFGEALAFLRRDVGRNIATRFGAGVGVVSDSSRLVRPVALASAIYSAPERGLVSLTVGHSLEASLFLAESLETDSALLRGSVPLPFGGRVSPGLAKLTLAGSLGARRSRALDVDGGGASSPWTTYLVDSALSWAPRSRWTVSLRHQFVRQVGDPMLDGSFLPFTRNVVLVTVAGRLPDSAAAGVLGREPDGERVDGSDRVLDVEEGP
jgi:hypothetical protein